METTTASHVDALCSRKRKRKEDSHNERLSKRLSLLNIDRNGINGYVPLGQTQLPRLSVSSGPAERPSEARISHLSVTPGPAERLAENDWTPINPIHHPADGPRISQEDPRDSGDQMQLDDSKHKVYIYNLDDELSSDGESEEVGLTLLPGMETHLRTGATRLPLFPPAAGGHADKQLVLYSIPSSISVPQDQDSVRKAIIEARHRARQKDAPAIAAGAPGALLAPPPRPATFGPGEVNINHQRGSAVATGINIPSRSLDDGDAMELDVD